MITKIKIMTKIKNILSSRVILVANVVMLLLYFIPWHCIYMLDNISTACNVITAVGTAILSIYGILAYHKYWRKKNKSTIYNYIIEKTYLMHTDFLKFKKELRKYSYNILENNNVSQLRKSDIEYLIIKTTNTLNKIEIFSDTINTWQARLDYIALFMEQIKIDIDTKELYKCFEDLENSIDTIVSQIKNIIDKLEEIKSGNHNHQIIITEIILPKIPRTEEEIRKFIASTIKAFS